MSKQLIQNSLITSILLLLVGCELSPEAGAAIGLIFLIVAAIGLGLIAFLLVGLRIAPITTIASAVISAITVTIGKNLPDAWPLALLIGSFILSWVIIKLIFKEGHMKFKGAKWLIMLIRIGSGIIALYGIVLLLAMGSALGTIGDISLLWLPIIPLALIGLGVYGMLKKD